MNIPPFRADHVGSLLRPADLRGAFRSHARGELPQPELDKVTDAAVRHVIALQESVGLQVVNDGEYRRGSFWSRFVERVHGFRIKQADIRFRDDSGQEAEFTASWAFDRVRRVGPITLDEYTYAAALTNRPVKVTLPAPSNMHAYSVSDWADPKAYVDAREFFVDMGQVYREEIAALYAVGCRYVQLDEVACALLCDERFREHVRAHGHDPEALTDLYIDAINEAVRGRPADMAVGVHMCRGNFKGKYLAAGSYERVADKLFNRADATHFLLEYDTERAGDFSPLRFMPAGKGAVLGMISSKTPVLESMDTLKRRADEAGRYLPAARLGLCPQCGFASTVGGNELSMDQMKAKLALLVEAADRIF